MLRRHQPRNTPKRRPKRPEVKNVDIERPCAPPVSIAYFSAGGERTSDETGDLEQKPYLSFPYTPGQGRGDPWASPEVPSAPTRIITDLSVRPSMRGSTSTLIAGEVGSEENYREAAVGLLNRDPEDAPIDGE